MTDSEKKMRLDDAIVSPGASLSQAMAQLERVGIGALLLCDADGHLCGVLTDGDIRRAVLRGRRLDDSCGAIATVNPISAQAPVMPEDALRIMDARDIHHLPVVDAEGRLLDLVLRQDLTVDGDYIWNERRLVASIISPMPHFQRRWSNSTKPLRAFF